MSLAFEAFGDTTYVALQEFATTMELPANIKLPKGPDEVEQFIDEIWGLILPENSTWVDLWEPEPLPFEDLVLKKVGGKWKFHIDTSDLGFDSFGVLGLAR